jgi:putative oxidoreductase
LTPLVQARRILPAPVAAEKSKSSAHPSYRSGLRTIVIEGIDDGMNPSLSFDQEKLSAAACAILRVGIGLMFIAHGVPKLLGGPPMWTQLGGAMQNFGIAFAPAAWGLAAALAEAVGGLALALGFGTRLAAAALLATMIVASGLHLAQGEGFAGASHALEDGVVFLAFLIAGPGRHSLDEHLRHRA